MLSDCGGPSQGLPRQSSPGSEPSPGHLGSEAVLVPGSPGPPWRNLFAAVTSSVTACGEEEHFWLGSPEPGRLQLGKQRAWEGGQGTRRSGWELQSQRKGSQHCHWA